MREEPKESNSVAEAEDDDVPRVEELPDEEPVAEEMKE